MSSIQEFYNTHAARYEEFEGEALQKRETYPLLYDIRHEERRLLERGEGKRVFSFATGSGQDVASLAKSGAKVVTLDFSFEMIKRTCERLRKEGIGFMIGKNISYLTREFLDTFFEKNPRTVLILLGNIQDISLPKDYFDYTFCYCTLPLLGREAIHTLKKLLFTSKNGAVSVYDKEKLPVLHTYYTEFGFNSAVSGRVLSLEGGFEYSAIPPADMKQIMEQEKHLEIVESGLGKIYLWSEKPVTV